MALATKCPHCNTTFRVAHDQLKLRGGIVRCGACNEVFDGNAALLEPIAPPPAIPPPEPTPFDEKMAALDTRAAEVLGNETIHTLELDTALDPADTALPPGDGIELDVEQEPAAEAAPQPEPALEAGPGPEPALAAEPAAAPAAESPLDLDLDLDLEPEPQPEHRPPFEEALDIEALTDEELDQALEAELEVMEHAIASEPQTADGRREPTWDDAAADDTIAAPAPWPAPQPHRLRDDELDEVDEEALVQLSSAGLAEAQSAGALAHLHATADAAAAEEQAADDDVEPGFVKRDRLRQKFGKAATIAMSLGSLLLAGALVAQGLTTYRNQIAAAVPPLKPALLAACATLGCKIELPSQIDDLSIEQGELQTLSETTFSFTTLLRNQGAMAQAWPHIELVLDDAADQRILRRVFTPRDYLGADAAPDKGFAPHTEQSVKLYFELHELKASGYHIAVFYP